MGVKNCNRKGCDNIMCDRYSPRFGYICYECFSELESLTSEPTVKNITKFMESSKSDDESEIDLYEEFQIGT